MIPNDKQCIICHKYYTTNKIGPKHSYSRWYRVKDSEGNIIGYKCHNCYIKKWRKEHDAKRKS